ncbi:MAG: dTMP kinase [Candidatus Abawacabacteria bacterium RIFCSPHIGHO2_01_FULL_46_8]|uniref:Thymidylate kinase n=1 Tax=Candidatus Abawacabacteria bacterium RIFCSPHIGHO2_01_FULL_46_8 TaxID=1817815 RepID=A0A1F4XNK2_9BACT|nr:MAG: dTMP kinase [Candidatus Abawacabacteria bacterium RIFCSPHIGHO2_01_FULL_46_8]
MLTNSHPGKFIALEALDGSGASTQIELLAKFLEEEGQKVHSTKEPTNNLIGGIIRGALTKEWQPSLECLQLLFAADRAHHLQREIIPSLLAGRTVITDRYFFSTIAFGSLEVDEDWLRQLNERFLLPDLTIMLKVSPAECVARIAASRRAGFELFEEEQKLTKIWASYQRLAATYPNVYIVDGERPIEDVAKDIKQLAAAKLLTTTR